jgi:uncharacterized protein YbbC (DUF1343 family)
MIQTGLDRLLADLAELKGRRFGLLAHAASVSSDLEPAHVALARGGVPPAVLFGPEHGFYGIEQDMVAAPDQTDPLTGIPVRSLYGDSVETLRPAPGAFEDLDLLIVDMQDVGSRYYTYAATAVWAARAALEAGCEVWVLDRPNPLGGIVVEGNVRSAGFASFVGAFPIPVRHGLTLGELVRLEAARQEWLSDGLRVWAMAGWDRAMLWRETGLPWIAPSPNMPTPETAVVYPGACLVEATELSEGRGTTRPFELLGAPDLDARSLVECLESSALPGVRYLPTWFRPQFQKHAGEVCAGIQVVVIDAEICPCYRFGVEFVAATHDLFPDRFAWRTAPYEFVQDRPAIDLLTGSAAFRQALEGETDPAAWVRSWSADESAFLERRRSALLYPAPPG